MHDSARKWFAERAANIPRAKYIVEIGGRDINGSVRDLFPADRYLSLDLHPGPGVDLVADATEWSPPAPPDLVLCAEVLEHEPRSALMLRRIHDWLAPGGVVLIATVGDPWPPHSGYDGGPLRPSEVYCPVEKEDLDRILVPFASNMFTCKPNGDRFAVGIKAGGSLTLDALWPVGHFGRDGTSSTFGAKMPWWRRVIAGVTA